ncbi:MAG: TRAP transporter small permease subunit [Rhodospirillaceae bacterium]|nr:TRAP transporter small permease subunit [Rhodospirillaceae bacterium]
MPALTFVLPHWLYWSGLILFPLVAAYLVSRQLRRGEPRGPMLFVAYLFWLCSGFLGLHRLYLKNVWGFVFLPLLVAILYCNSEIRDAREHVSRTRSELESAHAAVERAAPGTGETADEAAAAALKQAQDEEARRQAAFAAATAELADWQAAARWMAILLGAMLVVDAALLPGLVRRARAREVAVAPPPPEPAIPEVPMAGTGEDPTLAVHTRITDAIEWLSTKTGAFVAYWSMIAVFVYYYEVIARYLFNSPTNWVHESMFLMFGMQYMISGAYAYREDQHVRVDVVYARFSPRRKAIADIITSLFFFIFTGTMLWTGVRFATDAIALGEDSFTEWGIQYWPVKLMIPVGAGLIVLQGLAKLIKDIRLVVRRGA